MQRYDRRPQDDPLGGAAEYCDIIAISDAISMQPSSTAQRNIPMSCRYRDIIADESSVDWSSSGLYATGSAVRPRCFVFLRIFLLHVTAPLQFPKHSSHMYYLT
jgi:hypothetical protein